MKQRNEANNNNIDTSDKTPLLKSDNKRASLIENNFELRENHVKFYKTSIERWQPVGDAKIHCIRCKSHVRPIVKHQTAEHISKSFVLSTFLMACWPLCFLPCSLCPEPRFEKLHCRVCNYNLGIYDHHKNTVVPNPNLLKDQI
jgi:hypothetical protein